MGLNTGFTGQLAQWIGSARNDWPAEALDRAERAIVDTVGCVIAGAGDEAVRRVGEGVGRWGGSGSASVVGVPNGCDAPWAALVNGTAAHALDYDDVLDPAASHVSAVLVPALLALGEEIDASGADLLDAYIVGVEVQECLAEAVNMAHYASGWHTTLTLGVPSAAAACARLLRLDGEQACNAMSLATSFASGFKRQFGTNAKPFHAGLGAKNGIVAARMAAAGLTADPAAFEGPRGFLDLMVGPGAAGFGSVLSRLDGPPAVVSPGVWMKRYPCCASTHRAVDGLLGIMRDQKLRAADIASVDTLVSEVAVRNLMYTVPGNEMEARFSMAYCVAAAALDKDLSLSTFERRSIGRADVSRFIPCVAMRSDPEQPADMPSTMKSWATTTITTVDGRSHISKVVSPRGYPDNPLDETELAGKFSDCVMNQTGLRDGAYAGWRSISSAPRLRALCADLRRVMPHRSLQDLHGRKT
jgi:2-methylcitrate dehydratase PrpD